MGLPASTAGLKRYISITNYNGVCLSDYTMVFQLPTFRSLGALQQYVKRGMFDLGG